MFVLTDFKIEVGSYAAGNNELNGKLYVERETLVSDVFMLPYTIKRNGSDVAMANNVLMTCVKEVFG